MPQTRELTPQSVQTIASVLAGSDIFLGVILYVLTSQGIAPVTEMDEDTASLLTFVLGAGGLSALAMSFFVKPLLLRGTQPILQRKFTAVIASLSLSDGAGMLGFAIGVITGNLMPAYILLGLAGGVKVFHWPTRAWLERPE